MVRPFAVTLAAAALSLSAGANVNTDASQYFRGDSSGVRNDDGALVVSYSAGRTAESFVQLAGRTPIIWARYNPGQAVGHILVTKAYRLPNGTTEVRVSPFRPSDGSRFSSGGVGRQLTYYGAVNPFAQFNAANDDYFRGINFTAFLAATGVVMRSTNASVAFVYYPSLTPTKSVTGGGNAMAWTAAGTANYAMEGRWLLGVQGETGDRRGLIPAYRVMGCNTAVDVRDACVVKGFASFIPWDFGNLASSVVNLATRNGAGAPDLGAMGSAFAGLEGYLRDASLWTDASWSPISGAQGTTGLYTSQVEKIREGQVGRRDQLLAPSAGTGLNGTATYGMVTPGTSSLWNPSDVATSEFITKDVRQVAGGLAATVTTTDWQQGRDVAQAQDVRMRQGTSAAVRLINGTAQ